MNGHVYPEIEKCTKSGQSYKNPRVVYRNLGNGNSKMFRPQMGPGINEHIPAAVAAFGDYDNDGDIDVAGSEHE